MPETDEFKFSLLENGLDFILSSVESLTIASNGGNNQKRSMKYAVLHLYAGIELILKARLGMEHWSLLFKDTNKANEADYSLGDFVSVSFQDCIERLDGIASVEISERDKKRLNKLRTTRNKLEHFGSVESLVAVISTTSSMFTFIYDFIEEHFDEAAREEEEHLLVEIRDRIGDCTAIIQQRWKEIAKSVDQSWSIVDCARCGQSAANVDDGEVRCLFCHEVMDAEDAAAGYYRRLHGPLGNRAIWEHDGEEWPIKECSECGNETLVTDDSGGGQCFHCGNSWGLGELGTCSSCGQTSPLADDTGQCTSCWQALMARD